MRQHRHPESLQLAQQIKSIQIIGWIQIALQISNLHLHKMI